MNTYSKLPGMEVHKLDGGLAAVNSVPGDVVLIIGTAPQGPYGVQLFADSQEAASLYGDVSKGSLLRGIMQAYAEGARNVAGYRLGAYPPKVDFINGYTVIVNEGSLSDYKVFLDASENLFRVVDKNNTVVFDSIAGTVSEAVTVYGSVVDNTVDIGDANAPVLLSELADFSSTTHSFTVITGNGVDTGASTADGGNSIEFTSGAKMELVKAGSIIGIGSQYFLVDYVIGNTAYFTYSVSYAGGAMTLTPDSSDGANAFVDAKVYARLVPGSDGMNMSLNETYAALQKAYEDLETAQVDVVVPMDVYIDSPNVVNNEGTTEIPAGDYLGTAYKFVANGESFFAFNNSDEMATGAQASELPSPYEIGLDGYPAKAWMAGTFKYETATAVSSQADIDALTADIPWTEVNFAHQLATYCYGLSMNDNEASGVISFNPRTSLNKRAWVGYLPTKDSDGNIYRSGSGILGNKILSGSASVSAGLFLTANDMYGGTQLIDSMTGNKIDIGYLIDVVVAPFYTFNQSFTGTTGKTLINGAAAYAGLLNRLDKNEPLTGKTLRQGNYNLYWEFSKDDLNNMITARMVPFTYTNTTPRNIKIVTAPTASLPTSDYSTRLTARVVSGVVDIVRAVGDKYVGHISGPSHVTNLQDDINSALFTVQQPGKGQYLISGYAEVRQTPQQRIDGEAVVRLTLVTVHEFRKIITYVQLKRT